MRRQKLAGKIPTGKPPDPENRSPGAVATATAAEVQTSILKQTSSSYPTLAAHASQIRSVKPTAAIRIVISPTPSGRKWIALLGERVLCVSAWPFVRSARLLLAEGYPADTMVEMWRPNSDEWALRGRLGAVAATIIDGETASCRAKNGAPVSFPGMTATTVAGRRVR